MKRIAILAVLSTSYMVSVPSKLQKKLTSPITYEVASSVTGYFLSSIIKSVISNDKLRGGIAIAGILGGIVLHKIYTQPALDKDKKSIDTTSKETASDDEFPLMQCLATFGVKTIGYAALWSSPSLINEGIKSLDKAKLLGAAKVAAPAALMGYGVISALD